MLRLIAAFCLFLLLVISTDQAQAEKRIALLIGNKSYAPAVGLLKNPHNDIALIAKSLRNIGLPRRDIIELKDASRFAILSAVRLYATRLAKAGPGKELLADPDVGRLFLGG